MNHINESLIKVLKSRTQGKGNTVNLLMDVLPMGKEAAYRRLRGEIPFTLEEAGVISRKFNISLDSLSEEPVKVYFDFKLQALFSKDPLDGYYKMIDNIASKLEQILGEDPDPVCYKAYRCLPTEFLFRYDSLTKIYILTAYPQYASLKLLTLWDGKRRKIPKGFPRISCSIFR